jgi:hypothetical protein
MIAISSSAFYSRLDKCVWDIDASDIPFFLGIDDA